MATNLANIVRRALDCLETADSRLRREITRLYVRVCRTQPHPEQTPDPARDPRLKRLLDAHYRARWRTGLASLLDAFLCAAVAFGAATLAGAPFGVSYRDDAFAFLLLASLVLAYVVAVYGSLRIHAASPGMRLLGIVAVSPRTGRPAGPHEVRPPVNWDYVRNRLPGVLFVPREDLGVWE